MSSCQPLSAAKLPILDKLPGGIRTFQGWVEDQTTGNVVCSMSQSLLLAEERCCRGILGDGVLIKTPARDWPTHVRGLDIGGKPDRVGLVNVNIAEFSDNAGVSTELGKLYEIGLTNETAAELYASLNKGKAPRIFYLQHDATQQLPFDDHSIEHILSEHFIEHISFDNAVAFLTEARRLLAPGGTLRLSTPDFAMYAKAYVAGLGSDFFDSQFSALHRTAGINSLHSHMSSRPMDLINQVAIFVLIFLCCLQSAFYIPFSRLLSLGLYVIRAHLPLRFFPVHSRCKAFRVDHRKRL
jgi:SAM-dependent methyltransferase